MRRQQGLDRRPVLEFAQGRYGGPPEFGVGVRGQRQEGRPARFAADPHQCLQGGPPDLGVIGAGVGDEARCGGRPPEAAQSPDRRGQQSGLREAGRQQVLQGSRHFPTTDALGGGDSRPKQGSVALGRSQDLGDHAAGLPIVQRPQGRQDGPSHLDVRLALEEAAEPLRGLPDLRFLQPLYGGQPDRRAHIAQGLAKCG